MKSFTIDFRQQSSEYTAFTGIEEFSTAMTTMIVGSGGLSAEAETTALGSQIVGFILYLTVSARNR